MSAVDAILDQLRQSRLSAEEAAVLLAALPETETQLA